MAGMTARARTPHARTFVDAGPQDAPPAGVTGGVAATQAHAQLATWHVFIADHALPLLRPAAR